MPFVRPLHCFKSWPFAQNGKVRSSFYHANLKHINFFDTKVSNESELCYFVGTCTQEKNTEKLILETCFVLSGKRLRG